MKDGDLSHLSIMELFCLEAENQCAILSNGLLQLEKFPDDESLLESLMRASHSIKGAARIVELHKVVRLAHLMEDIFEAARKREAFLDKDKIDLMLRVVDLLQNMASTTDHDHEEGLEGWEDDFHDMGIQLESLLKNGNGKTSARPRESSPAGSSRQSRQRAKKTRRIEGEMAAPLESDRDVRISAMGLSRLMGLIGEMQIESCWLPIFTRKLLFLKRMQEETNRLLESSEYVFGKKDDGHDADITLVDVKKKLRDCHVTLLAYIDEADDHTRRTSELSNRLSRAIITHRMRPFSEGTRGFPRMVRDVAHDLGKMAELEIVHPDTLVDRDILEKIESPLIQIIRNAIDHGIEPPAERMRLGKPGSGLIRIAVFHSSGMLHIVVSDDGKGIDTEEIRRMVVARNMVSAEVARSFAEGELLDFLFLPHFSTREKVSELSGRGIGLDVVYKVVHEVQGSIRCTTRVGEGTSFELKLPITLSVIRAVLVEISGSPYAFPLVSINRVLKVERSDILEVEGRQYFHYQGEHIGLVSLSQILDLAEAEGFPAFLHIVVVCERGNFYGLIVDNVLGIRELAVQTLDPRLGKVPDISAAAVLEDGSPVIILDVEDMTRTIDALISGGRLKRLEIDGKEAPSKTKHVLVVDDSITVREVERKMLSARGYHADVAVDGLDAWNAIRSGDYDLVITDIDMPRMDGIELVELIKNDNRFRFLPVIIVSYKDREEDRKRGLDAGADYYLTKGSFHDETFLHVVDELIGDPSGEPINAS